MFPPKEVLDSIDTLKTNDLIEVYWLDACSFQNVKILTVEVYITRKKTIGYFLAYKDGYLIILNESTNGYHDGTSIHVGSVEKIVPLTHFKKIPKKTLKTFPPTGEAVVKTVIETEKVCLHD